MRKGEPGLAREAHGMWRGGRRISNGYVEVRLPDHPRARPNGYVSEHLITVERALGKYLPRKHPIHHFDENKANNAPGNLVVCENGAYHWLLHRRARAMRACGDPSAHRCRLCKQYTDQDDITIGKVKSGEFTAYHRRCNNAYVMRSAARRRNAGGRVA